MREHLDGSDLGPYDVVKLEDIAYKHYGDQVSGRGETGLIRQRVRQGLGKGIR